MTFQFTEEQKAELHQRLADLDDNYLCFGVVFAEPSAIIEVVEDFLKEINNAKS